MADNGEPWVTGIDYPSSPMIEGFGQKIALHHERADLGMQLRHLGVAVRLNRNPLAVNDLRQLLDRLPLIFAPFKGYDEPEILPSSTR